MACPGYSVDVGRSPFGTASARAGTIRDAYLGHYNLGHGTLAEADLKGYACAMTFLDPASYSACYCGE